MSAADRAPGLRDLLAGILARRGLGEDYGFDLAPAVVPGPQGLTAGYVVLISCRSPVLAPARMAASHFVPDGWPGEAQLEQAAAQCLAGLAALRRRLLSPAAPATPPGVN